MLDSLKSALLGSIVADMREMAKGTLVGADGKGALRWTGLDRPRFLVAVGRCLCSLKSLGRSVTT